MDKDLSKVPTDTWIDPSPHSSAVVQVNGVQLHYLAWGGQGKPLLFLAGMGNSAHIFDDLATPFTERFRVLAMTRRGHGRSGKPETGYDLDTLVDDVVGFLDALCIERASIVGHSLAGDELTRLASRHPERVDKLVYLDPVLHHAESASFAGEDPVTPPPPSVADFASLDTIRPWLQRQFGFWSDAQEADLRATLVTMPDGTVRVGLPHRIAEELAAGMKSFRPDYGQVRSAALAFYAVVYRHPDLPADADEAFRRAAQEYVDTVWRPSQHAAIKYFTENVANGRIVELADAHHYLFLDRRDEVAREMRLFLAGE